MRNGTLDDIFLEVCKNSRLFGKVGFFVPKWILISLTKILAKMNNKTISNRNFRQSLIICGTNGTLTATITNLPSTKIACKNPEKVSPAFIEKRKKENYHFRAIPGHFYRFYRLNFDFLFCHSFPAIWDSKNVKSMQYCRVLWIVSL